MGTKYPHVFAPIRIRGVDFKNRIELAPPSLNLCSADHLVTEEFVDLNRSIAWGGASIITVGNVMVDISECENEERQLDLSSDDCIMTLSKFALMCEGMGAHASLEINHGGKDSQFARTGKPAYAPSSYYSSWELMSAKQMGREPVKTIEMTVEHIHQTVEKYAQATLRAKKAGMRMAMIHCGHANLISQFSSPLYNHRTDEYGGSLENRARFTIEILDRVRELCGEDFVIEARVSADEIKPGGMGYEETLKYIALIQDKIDILHVSAGVHGEFEYMKYWWQNYMMDREFNVHYAAAIKKEFPNLLINTVGSIMSIDRAEEIIASGKADFVSMCRPLLADPEMPRKYAEGREEDHRPCLRCQRCAPPEHRIISCSVNPFLGREREFPLGRVQKADTKRKVAVVGGGPGGITAAQILCMRGHDVTLYEKTGKLGGQLKYAALPTFKQDVADYLKYLERQAYKCGAKVLLNTEATREMLEKENYDAVIVAIGAEPIIPKLPGIDLPHVVWAPEADAGEKPCGQKVVVVGAGAVGMEAAIDLKKEGKDVTVIELLDNWSSLQKSASGGAAEFFAIIKELELDVRLGHKLLEVTPAEVICEDVKTGEPVRIPADSVLLAMGVKPRWAEADQLRLAAPGTNCFLIGDCLYVGDNIKGATSGALSAAAYL
jgi:2,4-dienoyl-CoA reductase-like NADH-dependent reductase (Old Yellow Enzyme family)/thioredoxin reductase